MSSPRRRKRRVRAPEEEHPWDASVRRRQSRLRRLAASRHKHVVFWDEQDVKQLRVASVSREDSSDGPTWSLAAPIPSSLARKDVPPDAKLMLVNGDPLQPGDSRDAMHQWLADKPLPFLCTFRLPSSAPSSLSRSTLPASVVDNSGCRRSRRKASEAASSKMRTLHESDMMADGAFADEDYVPADEILVIPRKQANKAPSKAAPAAPAEVIDLLDSDDEDANTAPKNDGGIVAKAGTGSAGETSTSAEGNRAPSAPRVAWVLGSVLAFRHSAPPAGAVHSRFRLCLGPAMGGRHVVSAALARRIVTARQSLPADATGRRFRGMEDAIRWVREELTLTPEERIGAQHVPFQVAGPWASIPATDVQSAEDEVAWSESTERGQARLVVRAGDLWRLQPEEYLNDTLVEYAFRKWHQSLPLPIQRLIHIANPFFYHLLKRDGGISSNLRRSTRSPMSTSGKEDATASATEETEVAFHVPYVMIPICDKDHWSLAIVCYAGRALPSALECVGWVERAMAKLRLCPEDLSDQSQLEWEVLQNRAQDGTGDDEVATKSARKRGMQETSSSSSARVKRTRPARGAGRRDNSETMEDGAEFSGQGEGGGDEEECDAASPEEEDTKPRKRRRTMDAAAVDRATADEEKKQESDDANRRANGSRDVGPKSEDARQEQDEYRSDSDVGAQDGQEDMSEDSDGPNVAAVPEWIREIADDLLDASDKLLEAVQQSMFVLETESAERLCATLHAIRDRVDALAYPGDTAGVDRLLLPRRAPLAQQLRRATEQLAGLPEPDLFYLLRMADVSSEAKTEMKRLVDELRSAQEASLARFEHVDTVRKAALGRLARALGEQSELPEPCHSSSSAVRGKVETKVPSSTRGSQRSGVRAPTRPNDTTASESFIRDVLRPYDRLDSLREATDAQFCNLARARAKEVAVLEHPWRDYVAAKEQAYRLQREFAALVLDWHKSIGAMLDDQCDDFILPSRDLLHDVEKELRRTRADLHDSELYCVIRYAAALSTEEKEPETLQQDEMIRECFMIDTLGRLHDGVYDAVRKLLELLTLAEKQRRHPAALDDIRESAALMRSVTRPVLRDLAAERAEWDSPSLPKEKGVDVATMRQQPCIVLLDSSESPEHGSCGNGIRKFLRNQFMHRYAPHLLLDLADRAGKRSMPWDSHFNASSIPLVSVDSIPKQSNATDCGLFLLEFARSWVETSLCPSLSAHDIRRKLRGVLGVGRAWFPPFFPRWRREQLGNELLEGLMHHKGNIKRADSDTAAPPDRRASASRRRSSKSANKRNRKKR